MYKRTECARKGREGNVKRHETRKQGFFVGAGYRTISPGMCYIEERKNNSVGQLPTSKWPIGVGKGGDGDEGERAGVNEETNTDTEERTSQSTPTTSSADCGPPLNIRVSVCSSIHLSYTSVHSIPHCGPVIIIRVGPIPRLVVQRYTARILFVLRAVHGTLRKILHLRLGAWSAVEISVSTNGRESGTSSASGKVVIR